MNIVNELKGVIRGGVEADGETLVRYSRDYSIFEVRPEAVVFPKDKDDIRRLVRFAREKRKQGERVSLTARSAGTDMSGGPLSDSIVVEFTRHFNKIKEIGPDYAVVEPGVYFRDLEKELDERGLMYPAFPASKALCAVGGIVANNSGGEKTLAYGKTEDNVIEVKMMAEDGEEYAFKTLTKQELEKKLAEKGFEGDLYRKIYKLVTEHREELARAKPNVSKNSAGYALWNVWDGERFHMQKLIVGSQGTLGIITEATLKLVPVKSHRKLVITFLPSLDMLGEIIVAALRFKPESMESYDDKTVRVALKYWYALLKMMKGNAVKLACQFLPELFMALRGGIPAMVLIVELASDNAQELEARAGELIKTFRTQFGLSARVTRSREESEKYQTVRRQSFNLLHGGIKNLQTAPFIDDFAVRPEYLPDFLPKLDALLGKYRDKMIYTVVGHLGDGNFHIIPLMNLADPEILALIPRISDEVYELVLRYNGTITAEHNDGIVRTPYLKKMYGENVYELFEETKRIFDPLSIFNPGKKVGGTGGIVEKIRKEW